MNLLNANYVDFVVLVFLIFFIVNSLKMGFWSSLDNLISFIVSIFAAFFLYPYLSDIIAANFNMSKNMTGIISFLMIFVFADFVISSFIVKLFGLIPKKIIENKWLNFISPILASIESVLIVTILFFFALSAPISIALKSDIENSKFFKNFVSKQEFIRFPIERLFQGFIDEAYTYFTNAPDDRKVVDLKTSTNNLEVDEITEVQMINLVNQERQKLGLGEVFVDEKLTKVARDHAYDMWTRKYFSHYSPDEENVADRLKKNNIKYVYAAENLALAPSLQIAHKGLMDSEGHKRNILDSNFKKIGIGVVSNGYYGNMYVQVFTN